MRVVFVAGASRSGSTMLGRLLSQCAQAAHLGELTFLWERGLAANELCGCGRRVRECEFWTGVLTQVFETDAGPTPDVLARLTAARHRVDDLPRMAFARPVADEPFYRETWLRLLTALVKAVSPAVVIDSSKRPSHGRFLSSLPGVQLDVVHLVRDSRAVAYSAQRPKPRPDAGSTSDLMPLNAAWRTALRWNVHNALAGRLRRYASSYRVVRYEDITANPEAEIMRLVDDLGLARTERVEGGGGEEIDLPVQHSVSGNPSRFQTGPTAIATDSVWQRDMPQSRRTMVGMLTAPWMRRYGYV